MSTAGLVAQRRSMLSAGVPAAAVPPVAAASAAAAKMLSSASLIGGSFQDAAATTTSTPANGLKRLRNGDHKDGRASKIRQRTLTETMEPPVLSFYGENPVPLPSRFGHLKRKLVAGHEAALAASWGRLITALRDEIKHIEKRGTELIPEIDFGDIEDVDKVEPFRDSLKRYGIGVVRGIIAKEDAKTWVDETKKYLESKRAFKPSSAQDPTCFDFFWTPCQVRARAHPKVLRTQKFAMSMWETEDDDRMAPRYPISYADRIRIDITTSNDLGAANGAAADASLPSTTSSTLIAQVDNGSLERWELDGYGRSGCYDAIWKGEWESYNPWDPTGRVNATPDLYNGAGACSMFRMFQGILALTTVDPGMVRLLPSPKLSTAYFLLRPFFSPKTPHPEKDDTDAAHWEEYLDPANWTLDKEQSTIIHGAVPGHAQRVTENWHPHLDLRNSLVAPPTLNPGDYIVWHPDQAYSFDRAPPSTSMLVYTPAAPLTQTNALFLARQRKAFLRGHPGPDFDSTGSGLGSEAPNTGRLEEKDIAAVGGEEGLQAMGLTPWNVSKVAASKRATPEGDSKEDKEPDAEMSAADSASDNTASTVSAAEAEVVRLANIILFPDRYDFWMPSRTSTPSIDAAKKREQQQAQHAAAGSSSNGNGSKESS